MQQSRDGSTVVERVTPRRAPDPPRHRWPATAPQPVQPAVLARRLVTNPTAQPELPLGDCEKLVAAKAAALDGAQARLLSHAIEQSTPVRIEYISSSGGHTDRVIEPVQLIFDALQAWCRLRGDERFFRLDRIRSVSPA